MSHSESRQTLGLLAGLLGVVIFSLTLPMTKLAVTSFDGAWIALIRAEGAAILAAIALWVTRSPRPHRAQSKALVQVIAGVVIGFPLFTSLAMQFTQASYGAVVVGLLPIATAIAAAWLTSERPSLAFWVAALVGSGLVSWHAINTSGASLGWGNLFLALAVIFSAMGYAAGGQLAKSLGGWQTIAWALVYAAPFLLIPTVWASAQQSTRVDLATVAWPQWAALAYLVVFSQFLGFFAWYGGMALGGVARVSQVQLLQLFFTLGFSAWLLGEAVSGTTWLVGAGVLACIVASRMTRAA
jgi:drug/metabolite transporter (DMT)-like permease